MEKKEKAVLFIETKIFKEACDMLHSKFDDSGTYPKGYFKGLSEDSDKIPANSMFICSNINESLVHKVSQEFNISGIALSPEAISLFKSIFKSYGENKNINLDFKEF